MSLVAVGVVKATKEDAYSRCEQCYGMPVSWTYEREGEMIELLANLSLNETARRLGLSAYEVGKRAKTLKIRVIPEIDRFTPSDAEWRAIATEKAREAAVRPADVMGHSRVRAAIVARWRAWRAILAPGSQYTIAGLARVSGFHHTSIMNGLDRLRLLEAHQK